MEKKQDEYKVTWKGWLSLFVLVLSLSGVLSNAGAPWKAFDFMVLSGQFGAVSKGVIFTGQGGTGAREGFMFALTLFPTVIFAMGCIQVADALGALRAAEILFRPILRPLLGIPGASGLALVSSFTSTDVGAVLTKDLVDNKLMTDDERTVFAAFQFAGSAPVVNTFGTGGPLLGITVLPVGLIILLIVIVKFIGANIVRFYLKWFAEKNGAEGEIVHG